MIGVNKHNNFYHLFCEKKLNVMLYEPDVRECRMVICNLLICWAFYPSFDE